MIKVDATQRAIVDALRAAGCSVEHIASATGRAGIPDLLVGHRGRNWLLEVKALRGKRAPKAKPLSEGQQRWFAEWRGSVYMVATPEQALAAVGLGPSL